MNTRRIIPYAFLPMKAEAVPLKSLDLEYAKWYAEPKLDGARYFLRIGAGGDVRLISPHTSKRTGHAVDKTDNVPHITASAGLSDWYASLEGTVLDGEITVPNAGHSKSRLVTQIMGCTPVLAAQRQKDSGMFLAFNVFDVLWYRGKHTAFMMQAVRRSILERFVFPVPEGPREHIRLVRKYPLTKRADVELLYASALKDGGEGLILKNSEQSYVYGRRYKEIWIKLKREATYDGIVTGVQIGRGKYAGMIGALVVSQFAGAGKARKLTVVSTISGMTDPLRKYFMARIDMKVRQAIKNGEPKQIVELPQSEWFVAEFKAQECEEKSLRYRHPRFVQERRDKRYAECVFAQR